jgi:protoheme IX farnesyltransferase
MLPVVAGAAATRRQILLYSLALVPVGAAPWLLGYAGVISGVIAVLAGGVLVALAWQLDHKPSEVIARRLFAFSILYLFALFAALLIERALGLQAYGWLGRVLA